MSVNLKPSITQEIPLKPLEVEVTGSFEDAFRRFKTLVQAEGIIADYKVRQRYEKPSEKKRRKQREAAQARAASAARERDIASGEWEKRQKKKEQKKQAKQEARRNRQKESEL